MQKIVTARFKGLGEVRPVFKVYIKLPKSVRI